MDLPGQAKAYRPTMNDTWRIYGYRIGSSVVTRASLIQFAAPVRFGMDVLHPMEVEFFKTALGGML